MIKIIILRNFINLNETAILNGEKIETSSQPS
jgi:hypothetical protein